MTKKKKQTKRSKSTPKTLLSNPLVVSTLQVLHRLRITTARIVAYLLVVGFAIWLISLPNWSQLFAHLDLQVLLEYLKVLAWPGLILAVFLLLFHDIQRLVQRIKSLNIKGNQIDFQQQVPTQALARLDETEPVVSSAPSQSNDNRSVEDILNEAYPQPEVQLDLERVYRNIFGTQISLLQRLSGFPNGLRVDQIFDFYNLHVNLVGATNLFETIEQYLTYLIESYLVDIDQASGLYKITAIGSLFLRYLIDQRISDPAFKRL